MVLDTSFETISPELTAVGSGEPTADVCIPVELPAGSAEISVFVDASDIGLGEVSSIAGREGTTSGDELEPAEL